MSIFVRLLAVLVALALPAAAEDFSALARIDADASGIAEADDGSVTVSLTLSQAVPWRAFTLDDPRRLILDFSEADWEGPTPLVGSGEGAVTAVRGGTVRPGWSRLILDLGAPVAVAEAGMETQAAGPAVLTVRLDPVTETEFRSRSGAPESARFSLPEKGVPLPQPERRQDGSRPLRVVLDPGHGGVDPGAERGGLREADIMLIFAKELDEVLTRAGMEVVLTRQADVFVPLETRISIAREAKADVFLSLHADSLSEGRASGATVYTLSDAASDRASALLAERHDRADLVSGVNLEGQDDTVAEVLMDLARTDTAPRSDRLADALVEGLKESVGKMHKRPRMEAGFSVLKAPDIPSALIEVGFISSDKDRENLTNGAWRARAMLGIATALERWARDDAAQAALLRQ